MDRVEELAAKLEGLRTEIAELKAVEEPTEEQSARMEAILPEWDEAEAAYTAAKERAEKIAHIEAVSLESKSNREAGFGAPNVIVRDNPFEGVEGVRPRYTAEGNARMGSDEVIERAHRAFEGVTGRGVKAEHVESLLERVDTIPGAAEHALVHGSPAYQSAFRSYLAAQGQNVLYSPEESAAVRAALALGNSTGGFSLPTLLDPTLIHTGTATKNPIRNVARVVQGTQNVWHGVSVGNVTTAWLGEGSAMSDGSPTFAGPSVTAAKLVAYVTGSYEIFEDSALQSQLPGLIGEAFSFAEQTAFISGSGSNAPKGIVTAISATAGSTVTATTRGAFTTASAVDVFALLNAVPSRYEDSATWVANKQTFNTIKQMSTGSNGSYFWSDFNAAIGSPLLGSPILQASDMPTTTVSGTVLIVLGDFSQFVVYDRLGTSVEFVQNVVDTNGLPTGQRGLIAHKRVGSDVTDLNAFRFLKC